MKALSGILAVGALAISSAFVDIDDRLTPR